MKLARLTSFAILLLGCSSLVQAEDLPQPPPPVKEHEWLQQLPGEWTYTAEMFIPGQEPMKAEGKETIRAVGGFWTVAENSTDMMGHEYQGIMTLGYDAPKKKYVGTWVDSMSGHLWVYDGHVSADGKTLTLEAQGPCPLRGGKMSDFKDVLEIKSKDHKVFTGSVKGDDGEWITLMKIDYKRKK